MFVLKKRDLASFPFRARSRPLDAFLCLCCFLFLFSPPSLRAEESRPLRLMVFGDSLVHGYGLSQGEAFPEQLEKRLQAQRQEVEVINAGNSGDTTAAALARVDWAMADEPDAVIIVLGGNDFLRGLSPEDTRHNLAAILEKFHVAGVEVLLTGMKAPRNLGRDYVEAFDPIYADLAKKYTVGLYPFFLEAVALKPRLNQRDGLHPNSDGVKLIVENILPFVNKLLKAKDF